MENENITILWLDDEREPYSYFKKKKKVTGAWVRNNNFYQENIFNKFKPNFIWVKNLPEFSEYIIKNGLPDLVSFDHDLSKIVRCDHNGADCARWLVNYCKENGLQMPKCFAHTANNKQRPVINDILGLNEDNKQKNKTVMKINETQLRKIIKESIVKILKESDFDNESDYGDNKLLYRGNGYEIIVDKDNTELYLQFEDSYLVYDADGEWFDSIRGEVIEVPKEDFEYFGGEGIRLDKKAVSIITRFVSQLTPGSKYANPEFYI